MNWFDYVIEYGKKALPYISTVASIAFPQISWLPVVLSAIPKLVNEAEEMFDEGAVKKDHVLSGLQVIADTMAEASTGGQKATWESLKPMLGDATDLIVAGANITQSVIDQFEFNKQEAGA